MAIYNLARFNVAFLLLILVSTMVIEVSQAGGPGSLTPEQCPGACDVRCSATSHRKPCLFFCNKCCDKCLCVPSGTYGHKEECPCYNDWKTQEGGPKCP
ncbi:hypothetical protein RND81_14G018100 [Saponaria officinalis]|uniref:Uncharacterized protein n=1 Tax=Saponaria officinalis TaxID=3572 RepID=A0AAW1GMA0_SAPOF